MKINEHQLSEIKQVLRCLLKQDKRGGAHIKKVVFTKRGISDKALQYLANKYILKFKQNKGEKVFSINPKNISEASRLLFEVKDTSEL